MQTESLPATFMNTLGMEFVLVPKGKSWLGGGGGKPGDTEVEIVHDFYLGKYEVTQQEWEKLSVKNLSKFIAVPGVAPEDQKRFPVENVSWQEAQFFVDKLNQFDKQPGWVYRLPAELEWEYACRGGPMTGKAESAFDFYIDKPANELSPKQANFKDTGLNRTCKVGSYPPNRLGLYDMHGNVREWCGNEEVLRGGAWSDDPYRAATRHVRPQDAGPSRGGYNGLRVARVPVGKEGK
jgi:formylglycine-generating enzyme required for sulfatase activity